MVKKIFASAGVLALALCLIGATLISLGFSAFFFAPALSLAVLPYGLAIFASSVLPFSIFGAGWVAGVLD